VAATQLVQTCKPVICHDVRKALTVNRLRRLYEGKDIFQMALGDFFARVPSGEFALGPRRTSAISW
jgi:hypothetical protein